MKMILLVVTLSFASLTGCAASSEDGTDVTLEEGTANTLQASKPIMAPAPSDHPHSANDPQPAICHNQCTFVAGDPTAAEGSPARNNRWLLPG